METELLTFVGSASEPDCNTNGGMLGHWAEIWCCQEVSRKHLFAWWPSWVERWGLSVPDVGLGPVHFIEERWVFAHERGRRKGGIHHESHCWFCGWVVCFFSRYLELESQLCDFLIAGQNMPTAFAVFTNTGKKNSSFQQIPSTVHSIITFLKIHFLSTLALAVNKPFSPIIPLFIKGMNIFALDSVSGETIKWFYQVLLWLLLLAWLVFGRGSF